MARAASNGHTQDLLPDHFAQLSLRQLINNAVAAQTRNAAFYREGLSRGTNSSDDPRRSIEDECGYPALDAQIDSWFYQRLYERDAIAARVIEVLPRSSWQVQPTIYEVEGKEATPFEQAWDDLSKQLSQGGYYQDEQGSAIFDACRRLDEQAGIGTFGVMLLGFDDGLPLGTPMAGVGVEKPEDKDKPQPKEEDESGDPAAPAGRPEFGKSPGKPTSNRWIAEVPKLVANAVDPETKAPPTKERLWGSDQMFQGSYGTVPDGQPPPRKEGTKLLYVRVFPETLVQVAQWESNPGSPRFGQPVRYLITLNDPRNYSNSVGMGSSSVYVHWSRVIHCPSDLASSPVCGTPRLRPVLDHVLALRKIYGASGEGYWRMAFQLLSFQTHPELGGDVELDTDALKDMYEEAYNSLQRAIMTSGMDVKPVGPQVTDPTPFVAVHLQAICIKIPCPKRVFEGSERGEMASAQDDSQWNDQLRARQMFVITPHILAPLIDRLIHAGVLPEPQAKRAETPAERYAKLKADAGMEQETPPGEEAEGEGRGGSPPFGGSKPGGFPSKKGGGFGGKPGGGFGKGKPAFSRNSRRNYRVLKVERLTANARIEYRAVRTLVRVPVVNAFCPTGEGGGVDPSCSPGGIDPGQLDRVSSSIQEMMKVSSVSFGDGANKQVNHSVSVGAKVVARIIELHLQRKITSGGDTDKVFKIQTPSGKEILGSYSSLAEAKRGLARHMAERKLKKDQTRNTESETELKVKETIEKVGVVESRGGYSIEWPDLDSLGKKDKSAIALQNTNTVAAYVSGQCESIIPPHQFLTSPTFLGMDDEEAAAMLEEAEAMAQVKAEQDAAKQIQEMELQQEKIDRGLAPDPTDPSQNPAGVPQMGPDGKPPPGQMPPQLAPFAARTKGRPETDGDDEQRAKPFSLNVEEAAMVRNALAVLNRFCATGEGGGVDPTCGGKGGDHDKESKGVHELKHGAHQAHEVHDVEHAGHAIQHGHGLEAGAIAASGELLADIRDAMLAGSDANSLESLEALLDGWDDE